jgi:hypothetical protein
MGAIKSTPTAAMEVLLNLTPLNLLIMAEARMALHRLHMLKQPAVLRKEAGLLSIWKNVSDPILDKRSDHTIPVYKYSQIFNVIIGMDYWRNKNPVFPKDALIWFTDGSRTDLGTGFGVYGLKSNKSYSFSLGKFASVFQTEIYAILLCAYENKRRAYKNKRILIFSDSQSALKTLSGPKVISRLDLECQEALSALAALKEITRFGCRGTMASLETKWMIGLVDKQQPCRYSVQSRLLEYLGVWQERQLRAGLRTNISVPGQMCQAADMASFLLPDHARKELMTCLS